MTSPSPADKSWWVSLATRIAKGSYAAELGALPDSAVLHEAAFHMNGHHMKAMAPPMPRDVITVANITRLAVACLVLIAWLVCAWR